MHDESPLQIRSSGEDESRFAKHYQSMKQYQVDEKAKKLRIDGTALYLSPCDSCPVIHMYWTVKSTVSWPSVPVEMC